MPLYHRCTKCTRISLVNSNTPLQHTGTPWLLLQQSLPEKKTGDILVTSQISSTAFRHLYRFIHVDLHVFNLFKPNRGLSQHKLCLVVLERCSLIVVFQDKFASLQQLNSPNGQDKFQICFIDIYLIRFLINFAVFCVFLRILRDFADLPEFRGSATAQNIRSPV